MATRLSTDDRIVIRFKARGGWGGAYHGWHEIELKISSMGSLTIQGYVREHTDFVDVQQAEWRYLTAIRSVPT